ncbi:acetyltransferase [Alkalihalobacillus alcalophilus ATCC 27647 = CGMCC 1.3604]|uniref:Acetyltransferase n=1 Tax=Alkalihalobacillus alcalophilus ATCC 27647 = CGMCC 1.3604 TaxID=1218173 RepID=A0A094YWG9_ALKAL|nr:GNAT family N-acetyltransferase [Alkalihalobacillus alcalophilus]KGA97867.1 acetyltransferase [Alkalihalobacillus alcalophilus ATCC 27647 = CGMCC 1.3604]MED1562112.1 GNAT family N-acetyltransferase [Alkalihalobacillus alcalophilus]THG88915.1 acetyltransferase [Alkalihalobacillus alcalophilus ATCC 27647 = CGMCC 1.3604]
MIHVRKASLKDADQIVQVCVEAQYHTYKGLIPPNFIEKTIREFYVKERIEQEIKTTSQDWNGWFVAVDDETETIVGAGGGGFIAQDVSELFVLYLEPTRKREGIGTQLLEAITAEQIERGAKEQWVSVLKNNRMGIPFYEAVGFVYQGEELAHGYPSEIGLKSLRYKRHL